MHAAGNNMVASYCVVLEQRVKDSQQTWGASSASIAHGLFHALVLRVPLVGSWPPGWAKDGPQHKWKSNVNAVDIIGFRAPAEGSQQGNCKWTVAASCESVEGMRAYPWVAVQKGSVGLGLI